MDSILEMESISSRKEFMAEKETIVTKMYDLVKYLMIVVNRFPRDHKFTLGDRIAQLLLELLEWNSASGTTAPTRS